MAQNPETPGAPEIPGGPETPAAPGTPGAPRAAAGAAGRFAKLPERIPLDETTASHPTVAPPDPTMGRDPERDFMLRYAGG